MKVIPKLTVAAVLVAFLCTAARAGDFATLSFIGFSKDGRYLAFEEYGTADGSGFPYSNIYVVDAEKNAFAATPVRIRIDTETATERQARSRAKLRAGAALKKFGIVTGNTGKQVVSRAMTDISGNHFYSEKPAATQTINFAEAIGSMYRSGDFDLTLKSVKTKSKECTYAEDDHEIYMLDISLYDREAKRTIVLQKDSSLPSSRACPVNYAMQHVYMYQEYLAVFINTYHMGFEGPDMRYMVVTAKVK